MLASEYIPVLECSMQGVGISHVQAAIGHGSRSRIENYQATSGEVARQKTRNFLIMSFVNAQCLDSINLGHQFRLYCNQGLLFSINILLEYQLPPE